MQGPQHSTKHDTSGLKSPCSVSIMPHSSTATVNLNMCTLVDSGDFLSLDSQLTDPLFPFGEFQQQSPSVQMCAIRAFHCLLCFALGCKLNKRKPPRGSIEFLWQAASLHMPECFHQLPHVLRCGLKGKVSHHELGLRSVPVPFLHSSCMFRLRKEGDVHTLT